MTVSPATAEDQLRDPGQILSLSGSALPWDARLVEAESSTRFWEILDALKVCLLVTREYEHLVMALSSVGGASNVSVMRLPHPSGLAVDRVRNVVHIACTRNPNQLMELALAEGWLWRTDPYGLGRPGASGLVPVATRFLPGCMYLHDLAFVGNRLFGNAVGMNAVVDLTDREVRARWWPRTIETSHRPDHSRNLIQLNSIAAGGSIEESFFTASTERLGLHYPGDAEWQIDRQGVIFAGHTREVVVRGLTRPHSARVSADGLLWVDDSGYGTLSVVDGDAAEPVVRLPGWTRGLCHIDGYAIVGTSRVIPRFAAYAPGVDPDSAVCGIHIVDRKSGAVEGSISWPAGNQIFAIDWLPTSVAVGFVGGEPAAEESSLQAAWYRYHPPGSSLHAQAYGG
jgi:uncharacterized protein (TIGR03032 family)